MQKIKNIVKAIQQDQRGYGMAELMLIIAVLGAVAIAVSKKLESGMEKAAGSVGDNVNDLVNKWGRE